MKNLNDLLSRIESAGLWSFFHKDWLLQIRTSLRSQLPDAYRLFVESESVLVSSTDAEHPKSIILPDVAVVRASKRVPQETSASESHLVTQTIIEAEEPIELTTQYSLLIRRGPENIVVAALEMLSPSNKGAGNRWDRERHLKKRAEYLETGINLLELDTLLEGSRDLPRQLEKLRNFDRIGWTAYHEEGRRRFRGWGWNQAEDLPLLDWQIDTEQRPTIPLAETMQAAADFNRWDNLVS